MRAKRVQLSRATIRKRYCAERTLGSLSGRTDERRRLSGKGTSMSRVVVTNHVTLDGVMQAPGRPDEDVRGGFDRGGWATRYADPVLGSLAGESMASTGAPLLG